MFRVSAVVLYEQTGSTQKYVDSQKLKVFSDDSFLCTLLSKNAENILGNGEITHYEQFLLFPQCFQKTCTADT